MKRLRVYLMILVGTLLVSLSAASAHAAFDLQVTEIWFGQDGTDLTEDWFEITNFGGPLPVTAASGTTTSIPIRVRLTR